MEDFLQESIGHLQCSRGLSLGAFLASCIDAVARLEGREPPEVLERLQRHLSFLLEIGIEGNFPTYTCSRTDSILILTASNRNISFISSIDLHKTLSLSNSRISSDSEWLLETCVKVFDDLTKIESKATGMSASQIKFKTSDLFSVLGSLYSLELLGTRQVFVTAPIPFDPFSYNGGSSLDILQELLIGFPIASTSCMDDAEPLDPLAVSLLRVLSEANRSQLRYLPSLTLKASGIGQLSECCAIVSLVVGRRESSVTSTLIPKPSSLWLSDSVTQMECNLDDTTGELLAHVIEVLLNNGAVDAWITPIVMKKGRPAHSLNCLCLSEREDKLLEIFFRHTTTLGVRIYRNIPRAKLYRSFGVAQTPYLNTTRSGQVDVKVSNFQGGEILSLKPEFDHCQEISRESGTPLKVVAEAALSDMRRQLKESETRADEA